MPEKKTKLKAGCGIAMVFGSGFLCGGLVLACLLFWYVPLSEGWKKDESKQFITNHIASRLDLTEEQLEQARPIIHEAIEKRYQRLGNFANFDSQVRTDAFEELKLILNDEQIATGEEMLERWNRSNQRRIDRNSE
ncbi:MAG: hypothetical protein HRU46_14280 [Verrucomicrobiales bacterium]|nr:hypothetical protein [Verrucomicrobiales bacterium]